MTSEEALARAEQLLTRLEEVRARLEQTEDPDTALELLGELADLAREVHAEIERAQREADALS